MTVDDLMDLPRDAVIDMIAASADTGMILEWFRVAQRRIANIRDDVESYKFVGTADPDWLRRTGGYLSHLTKVKRWTGDRLIELGLTPPWPPSDPRVRENRLLEARVRKLTAALRAANVAIPS
ncbi:MAG: hypothetical protein ABIQ81_00155 [Novosphingobium sp.]